MNATPCTVRSVGAEQAGLLGRLNETVQKVHRAALPSEFKEADGQAAAHFFAVELTKPGRAALLAELGNEPVGYALIEEVRRPESAFEFACSVLYVHHLAVVAAKQRSGVGRLLMVAVQAEAARLHIDEIRLDYWTFNHEAASFFASLGYEPFSINVRRAAH
jgi:GNAT superfamily N-acetyltransferase